MFKRSVCFKNERPPMPENCLPSLRYLIEACWQKEPTKRPSFAQIIPMLDIGTHIAHTAHAVHTHTHTHTHTHCTHRTRTGYSSDVLHAVVVDATVEDEAGRDLWKKNFLGKDEISWYPPIYIFIYTLHITT